MPEGANHVSCALCQPAGTAEKAEEVAEVADGERTFTETEHFALLTDAVARETASLSTDKQELEATVEGLRAEKSEEINGLQSRIDVLEAEKAAAEKARDEAVAEHERFKAELEELAARKARKSDRVERMKAAAPSLEESYFTEQRAERWAEMSDEAFETLIADITESAAAAKPASDDTRPEEQARESAAFTGGDRPTAGDGSLFGRFLSATGRGPAASH